MLLEMDSMEILTPNIASGCVRVDSPIGFYEIDRFKAFKSLESK